MSDTRAIAPLTDDTLEHCRHVEASATIMQPLRPGSAQRIEVSLHDALYATIDDLRDQIEDIGYQIREMDERRDYDE